MMEHVKTEEGTVLYTLNRTKDDPNTLIFMERYNDQAGLDAHSGSDEFKAFNKKIGGCVAGRPEITMMEEIASI